MAEQLACVFSTVEQLPDDSFQPSFVSNMQAGERFSGSIERLPDFTQIPVAKDFVTSGSDLITAQGLTLCYVWADETRVTLADGLAQYHVLWRMYTDDNLNPTPQMARHDMTGTELSAIQSYLSTITGYNEATISSWLVNQFNVETQQEAVNWSTSRPRYQTVHKLMIALSRYAEAKAELDTL